ncbi:hypothetical protein GCM10011403_11790 [Pseudohongiella nitratireducens]|uniref:Uncharacterized protein n=1 Tax=Pseudohongiella nitratireducens TaxID=1768907 RepID=A0A917GTP3_9GAMM|nr:hypothetical protein GCM10011403_11790 [Pseudohongiella nitratireducens]
MRACVMSQNFGHSPSALCYTFSDESVCPGVSAGTLKESGKGTGEKQRVKGWQGHASGYAVTQCLSGYGTGRIVAGHS